MLHVLLVRAEVVGASLPDGLSPFFPLLALTAGQDWTCEECVEGGALVGAYASSEKAIADQTAILLAEVCPSASDPEICLEKLPDFWSAISAVSS